MTLLVIIAAVISCASMGYCALCIWAAVQFATQQASKVSEAKLPPISILKPLKGTDPEMYESFRSHCLQEYPEYEILFGVSDLGDPAAALVEKLQREFPTLAIRLLNCGQSLGVNGKVSSLIQLAAAAKHKFLLVNDSDIRVEPDYLQTVIGELQEPDIGMVTCLYRGVPALTLGSRLESLSISTEFTPGVLVARQIEGGLHFGLGSTLAFRRRDLEAIGGFEAIVDYLADDYELGRRVADKGSRVVLSRAIVQTFLPAYGLAGFLSHQLRWARTIRASRPGGYLGLLLTYTLPWAVLCVVLARGASWAWGMFACAALLRTLMAVICGSRVRDQEVVRSLWLLPLRDLVAVIVWIGGLIGNTISWRGEKFHLRSGKLRRLHPNA